MHRTGRNHYGRRGRLIVAAAVTAAVLGAGLLPRPGDAGAAGSPSGTIVYGSCNDGGYSGFTYAVNPDGTGSRVVGAGGSPDVSSTGRVAAYNGSQHITTFPLAGGSTDPVRTLSVPAYFGFPSHSLAWSPDGSQIAFVNADQQVQSLHPGRIGVISDQTGATPTYYLIDNPDHPDRGIGGSLDWYGGKWLTFQDIGNGLVDAGNSSTLITIPAFSTAGSAAPSGYRGINAKFTPSGGLVFRNGNGLTINGTAYPAVRDGTQAIKDFAVSPDEQYVAIVTRNDADQTDSLEVVALDGTGRKTLDTEALGQYCGLNWVGGANTHTISGTLRAQDCTDTDCTQKGVPNAKVLVTGKSTDGQTVRDVISSGADGSWSDAVRPGSYTVAPTEDGRTAATDGWDPASRQVTLQDRDVPGQDFATCASLLPARDRPAAARAGHAPDPSGRCQASIVGFVNDQVQMLGGFEITIKGTTKKGVAVNKTVTTATDAANLGTYKQRVDPGTYLVSVRAAADGVPVNFRMTLCAGQTVQTAGPAPSCRVSISTGDVLKHVAKAVTFHSDCVSKVDFHTSMIAEGCFTAMDHKGIRFRAKGRFRMNGVDLTSTNDKSHPIVLNTQRKRIDGDSVKFSLSARGYGSGSRWFAWVPAHGLHVAFPSRETSWGVRLQTPWGGWRNIAAIGAGFLAPPKDGSNTLFGLPPVHAPYLRLQMTPGATVFSVQISFPPFTNAFGERITPYLDHNGIWKARGRAGKLSTVYPNIAAARVEADNSAGVTAIDLRGGPADAYLFPAQGLKPVAHKGTPPKDPSDQYRSLGDGKYAGSIELAQMRARWELGRGFRLEGALVLHAKIADRLNKLAEKFGGFLGQKVVIVGVNLEWRKWGRLPYLAPVQLDADVKSMHIPITEPPLFFWERVGFTGIANFKTWPPYLSLGARARFTFLPTFKHDFLWFQEVAALDIGGSVDVSPRLAFDGRGSLLIADSHLLDGNAVVNGSGVEMTGNGGVDLTHLRFPVNLKIVGLASFSSHYDDFQYTLHGDASLFSETAHGHGDLLISDHGAGACIDAGGRRIGVYFNASTRRWSMGGCEAGVYGSAERAGVQSNTPSSANEKGAADRHPASAKSAAVPTFVVTANSHLAAVAVRGVGSAPLVRLDGPGGLSAEIPAGHQVLDTPQLTMISNPGDATTYVYLSNPAEGTYTLTPAPGSALVRALDFAQPLPPLKLTASVGTSGCRRSLRWRSTPTPGQQVSFYEQSTDGVQPLGSSTAASGTVTFTPASGLATRRTVVAIVEQQGTPRGTLVLAHYTGPSGLPPEKVQGLRARGRGNRVQVSWAPACAASGYVVDLKGRGFARRLDVKGTTAVATVRRGPVTVTVRPYGVDGFLGRGSSQRVR